MNAFAKFVIPLVLGAVIGGAVVYRVATCGDEDDDPVAAVPEVSTAVIGSTPDPEPGAAVGEPGTGPGMDPPGAAPAGQPPAVTEEFEALMVRVFSGDASEDEQLEFWEQIRKTDQIDGVLSALREQVDAEPGDVTGRMTLAQLYTVKLLSAPSGPERGLLAAKAEEQWVEVLAIDPENFEAQYSIAFSLSQYPDFLNRTGDAILAYENAIAIEGRTASSEGTARAYVDLARLHQKSGDPASALDVLERGVAAHPDHSGITAQLEKLEKGFVFEEE